MKRIHLLYGLFAVLAILALAGCSGYSRGYYYQPPHLRRCGLACTAMRLGQAMSGPMVTGAGAALVTTGSRAHGCGRRVRTSCGYPEAIITGATVMFTGEGIGDDVGQAFRTMCDLRHKVAASLGFGWRASTVCAYVARTV